MALNHSPSIVTNGLVFAYDMGNIEKSFKGAPTTNYVTNALAMTGWNNYSNGTPVVITTSLGTPGYGFYNAGSWNGIYRSVTIPSTGTYTFSAWVRYIGGSANNNGGGVYISGWGGGDTASTTNRTLPGQWQRLSVTLNCTNTTFTFYLISWGGTNGADNSSWEMTMPQAEPGSFATPFVAGTRSNTQALVDLTGTNTITASSLTYVSDGTFSFNGSSDYCDVSGGGFVSGMTGYTICYWAKRTTGNRMPVAGRTSTAFYWYGDNSWAYTHGGTWGEYYYPKSVSIPDNTWGFFCCTYDGSNVKIYRNGVYEGQQATTGTADWAQGMRIGYWTGGNGYQWSGNISGVNFYNRALTAAEVKQNFNALRGRFGI